MCELKEKSELIKSLVQKEENNIVKFLRDLISIPSFSCGEAKVAQRIKKEMEKVGFDKVWIDDMGNVIGRIGKDAPGILYDGHIDTVGVKDKSAWSFDPFKGKVEKGTVYGRGASDNKAASTVQVYAGKILKKLGGDHKTIYVIGTVQEEDCDGLAMKYALTHSLKGKIESVVMGECTNGRIYRGHRGRMEIIITTKGKSCHASDPSRGDNAIYKMAGVISEIEKLSPKLKDHDFLGKGTVAVTAIECKTDSYNCVPYECRIYLDRRLTYGETKTSAVNELKKLPSVKKAGAKVEVLKYDSPSYSGLKLEVDKYYPTWILKENHSLVKSAAAAYEKLFDKKPIIDKWTFSTNGVASMGELGIPTIGFGPSEERFAHTTDDKVTIAQLLEATAFYSMLPYVYKK